MVLELVHRVRVECLDYLREQFPDASERDLMRRMADIMYPEDRELMTKAVGPLPEYVSRALDRNPFDEHLYPNPEDYILSLLRALDRDYVAKRFWEYVISLIKMVGQELKTDYLARFAAEDGTTHLLERAL